MDQTVRTILYTAETVFAQTVQRIGHETGFESPFIIDPVNTLPFDALGTL